MLNDMSMPGHVRRLAKSVRRSYKVAKLKRIQDDTIRYWRELRTFTHRGFSLRPFDRHRCIFVHVPKTGGMSVTKALFGNSSGGHRTVAEYKQIFGEPTFSNYFKFTFVRNPWDRLVSGYFYLKYGKTAKIDREWAERHLSRYNDFGAFVRDWVTPKNIYTEKHLRPQCTFLCDGRLAHEVDFLGRFENLRDDFGHVRRILGGIGSDLEHLNASKRYDYRQYYTDETRAIVAEAYRTDIELFGYEFDDTQRAHP